MSNQTKPVQGRIMRHASRCLMLSLLVVGATWAQSAIAAAATLKILESEPVHDTIQKRGRLLMSGMQEILNDAGLPGVVLGVPSMFGLALGLEQEPLDLRGYHKADAELYETICMQLIERGVQPDADGREPWFLCYSLSEQDVAETLSVFEDVVKGVIR